MPVFFVLMLARGSDAAADPVAPDAVAAMVAKVLPSVVRVIVVRPPAPPGGEKPDAKGGAAKPDGGPSATDRTAAVGSGYIIDPSGFIGTNRHVVDGAISVFVVTADGVRYPARIVGMTHEADIALLHIDAGGRQLPSLPVGDSDKMRVGDPVVAIGSPFGFDSSVTAGVVSALNRDIMESPFDDYMQTDAAINHGSSGGPLLNRAGEVIGMTSVIFSPDPGSAGVGFAVPSNDLQFVFERLMKTGQINAGMLPIHTQKVSWMLQQALNTPDRRGALVSSIQDPGDALLHGKIKPGDIIENFNGETVLDARDLARKAARATIGGEVSLEILRGSQRETVRVTVGAIPAATPIALDPNTQRTLGLELISGRGEDGKPIVTVGAIDPAGTAGDSGIQKGDIIVEIQQTPVSEPDEARRILQARSSAHDDFAAVLVEHEKKLTWVPLALPK